MRMHAFLVFWLLNTLSLGQTSSQKWQKVIQMSRKHCGKRRQEGHDGPVSLHWLIREIHSYQTLHYLGIGLKHKTPYKD